MSAAAPAFIRRLRDRRLNILFILTDQERSWRFLPEGLELPSRHAFAQTATAFNRYLVSATPCGPSRSVIYTGRHIISNRIYDNPGEAPGRPDLDSQQSPTLGSMLRQLGYYTVYKGKWHLHRVNRPNLDDYSHALQDFGFDLWQRSADSPGAAQEGFSRDGEVAADAAGWLRKHAPQIARDQPWFAAVNLLNPHDVMFYDAVGNQERPRAGGRPSPMRSAPQTPLYQNGIRAQLPPSFPGTLGDRPRAHAVYREYSDQAFGPIPTTDEDSWQRLAQYYLHCLQDVDVHIGTVLRALEESGQADRTVVVFSADHGELGGAHAMRDKGPFIYPELTDVPLLLRHPDIKTAHSSDALVSSVDLAPTFLGIAGLERGRLQERFPQLAGYSCLDSLANPGAPGERAQHAGGMLMIYSALYAASSRLYRQRLQQIAAHAGKPKFPESFVEDSVRAFYRGASDGRYRFARYFSPRNHHRPLDWQTLATQNDLELYDLATDPFCLTNLAAEPDACREILLKMNALLDALTRDEIGADLGAHMPGPAEYWSAGAARAARCDKSA